MKIIAFVIIFCLAGIATFGIYYFTQNRSEEKISTPVPSEQSTNTETSQNEPYQKSQLPAAEPTANPVPLPSPEYIITLFSRLVAEKKIPEAIDLFAPSVVPDDSTKQAWGVQLNSLTNLNPTTIEPYDKASWTDTSRTYKVSFAVTASETAKNEPIPYFGWDSNPSIRWVSLVKNAEGIWKISGIATGP